MGYGGIFGLGFFFFSPGMAGISCLFWLPSQRGVSHLPCGETGQPWPWTVSNGVRGWPADGDEWAVWASCKGLLCSLCAQQAFTEVLPGLRDTKQDRKVGGLTEGRPWGWRWRSWCGLPTSSPGGPFSIVGGHPREQLVWNVDRALRGASEKPAPTLWPSWAGVAAIIQPLDTRVKSRPPRVARSLRFGNPWWVIKGK